MHQQILHKSITYLKGVGPKIGELLSSELGIYTYNDLMNHIPFRYIDKSRYYTIEELSQVVTEVQVIGKITRIQEVKQKRGSRLVAHFEDETGQIELVWFKSTKWIKERLQSHKKIVIHGKLQNLKIYIGLI